MAVVVKWDDLSGIPVLDYKVYRSIIGFEVAAGPYGFYAGDVFIFEIAEFGTQYINFIADFNTTEELCNYINSIALGATAIPNTTDDGFIFRTDRQSELEHLEIYPCSVAYRWGQEARTINYKQEILPVGNTDPITGINNTFEYTDGNGSMYDWYAVSSVSMNSVESALSELVQPSAAIGDISYIHGMLIDLQGVPAVDAKVSAQILQPPETLGSHSVVTTKQVYTLSREDGTFTLPILQGTTVYFLINEVRVSDSVVIPLTSHVYWDD
ncbi:MAG: hypothetical protein DRI65_11480, partial [Chloroflexota bacterium]